MNSPPISPETGHGRQTLLPHVSVRFQPGRCNLCPESIGRHITCGQHIECSGFTGVFLLPLPCCCFAIPENHPPCSSSHRCSAHGLRILMNCSVSLALPFIRLASPRAPPEPSEVMAHRAPPGWAASMVHATATVSDCFACCCEGSRAAWGHLLDVLLRSLTCSKEKCICLFGRAQLKGHQSTLFTSSIR